MIHPCNQHALERNQDDETVTKDIVVECAQKLCGKERREATLSEQPELARS